jgi:hypothetical protein
LALVFPNEDALRAALKAGLVPPDVQRGAVRVGRTADGQLELQPDEAMSAIAKAALKNAGVTERAASAKASSAPCWAAALKPLWAGEPDTVPGVVLFVLSDSKRLLPLCGELLRLGCDRQELRMLDKRRALLRVREAPYFVVAKASEPKEELLAFAAGDNDRYWIQLGFHHPLSDALERPASGTLLIHGDGTFETLEDGPFTPLDALIVPSGLPQTKHVAHVEAPPHIAVQMRLLPSSRTEEPALWLVRDGVPAVEAYVRGAPEASLEGVLFAVAKDLVVLKVRAGHEKSVSALPGEPFVRVAELPNLFAPLGTALEPPLSRERLRDWLAADPDQLVWLERDAAGKLTRHAIAETGLAPLGSWVDYVIDTSRPALEAWVKSTTFEFEAFEGRDETPAPLEQAPSEGSEGVKAPRSSPRRPSTPRAEAKGPPTAPLNLQVPSVPAPLPLVEQQLAHEEAAFLALEAEPDSTERQTAWTRLAGLYVAAAREHEGGLAFAHSLWELSDAQAAPAAGRWAQSVGSNLATLLQLETPSEAQTRALVAQLYAAALARDGSARARLAEVQAWLDKHDDNLDVRALWLGRVALSRLAGHDALGLARARDRVLTRLRRGLSLERDVPRFLRAAGPNTTRDNARVERVTGQLDALLKAFDETPRKRSPTEADWKYTRAWVGLTFAWGFARLGSIGRARELQTQALSVIDTSKPFNGLLARIYAARIEQAAEGLSPTTPLPTDHTAAIAALPNIDRYRVDLVRQHLAIVEPHEHFEAPGNQGNTAQRLFLMRMPGAGIADEDVSALRQIEDPAELARAISQRIDAQPGSDAEEERMLASLASSLPRLPEASGLLLLRALIARADPLGPAAKSRVLESALQVAAHFGNSNLAKQLVGAISSLIAQLGPQGATRLTGLLVTGMRTLRRTGHKEEASTLLMRAATVIKGESLEILAARLAIAGGFAYLGRIEQVRPTLEEALGHLARETSPLFRPRSSDPTYLARHTARALAMAPPDVALAGLRRVAAPLPWLSDMYSTNDYFCLSVVELADILVVGHVGEDLTLSEVTRTFLEEDEYRVRRRIHREAGG